MKIKFISKLSLIIGCFLVFSNCSTNDDSSTNNNSAEINQIKSTVMASTWQITNFIDSGIDETNHFMGYSFTFNSDGSLIASNGSTTINGTWSVTDSSNSNDDSSSDDIDFNIFFSSPANFNDDLTEDWNVVSRTNSKIELIHISGGNGGTDALTFEKVS